MSKKKAPTAREDQALTAAKRYTKDTMPSQREEVRSDFIAGWRAADETPDAGRIATEIADHALIREAREAFDHSDNDGWDYVVRLIAALEVKKTELPTASSYQFVLERAQTAEALVAALKGVIGEAFIEYRTYLRDDRTFDAMDRILSRAAALVRGDE